MQPLFRYRASASLPRALLTVLFWSFLATLLVACAASSTPPPSPLSTTTPWYVTVPPDSTATATPFPPLPGTDTPPPSLTPRPSLSPVSDQHLLTSTPDFSFLLATTWTPPTFIIPTGVPTPMPLLTDNEMITFLLLGSDTRLGLPFRTDTIIVAAIRPKIGKVSLISIPRDLWVYIPGWEMQRINTAYVHGASMNYPGGGEGMLKDTILYNLGLRVDHTAVIDFNGFRQLIDALDGVDVPVVCPYTDWRLKSPELDPQVEENWELYTIYPGIVHMDGDLALWYARSRLKSTDYDRNRRQQEVLRAIYAKSLRLGVIPRLPQLYVAFRSLVRTDVNLDTLLALAPLTWTVSNADIRSYYIAPPLVSGQITSSGAWIAVPDGVAIRAMLERALSPSPSQQEKENIVVEVWNGTPHNGWDRLAVERLNYAGYEARLATPDHRDHAQTLLYDLTIKQDQARAAELLSILGLSSSALIAAPGYRTNADYILIVGTDYQPCFKPQNLIP